MRQFDLGAIMASAAHLTDARSRAACLSWEEQQRIDGADLTHVRRQLAARAVATRAALRNRRRFGTTPAAPEPEPFRFERKHRFN